MLASQTDKHWNKGYVSGAFDMFHIGHLNLIRNAKARCDYLMVGVMTDKLIESRKNRWPVIPLNERMEIIAALKCVDEVDVTTEPLIYKKIAWKKYGFNAMFSGDDHINDGWGHDEAEMKELGVDLVFFPYTKEVSTTRLQEMTLPQKAEGADKARRVEHFTHIFPFDKVNKGERIVIYGTGHVGEQFARQLAAVPYCRITAFADTYAAPGTSFYEKPCLSLSLLMRSAEAYDRIVIASTIYYEQILGCLRAAGVPPERIV